MIEEELKDQKRIIRILAYLQNLSWERKHPIEEDRKKNIK